MGSLALALAGMGQLNKAHDAVNNGITAAGGREGGQQWYVPELLRIKAEILLRQPPDRTGVAEKCLEQAATMAREQGALTWELRIALSIARSRVTQGRGRRQAREALLRVYERYTEGFTTTDLRASNARFVARTGLLKVIPDKIIHGWLRSALILCCCRCTAHSFWQLAMTPGGYPIMPPT